jgi:hypothetical protein
MPEKNNNNANIPIKARYTRDSYQPDVNKTDSPAVPSIGRNYQPVIPKDAGSEGKKPPTGGSGVPLTRNSDR